MTKDKILEIMENLDTSNFTEEIEINKNGLGNAYYYKELQGYLVYDNYHTYFLPSPYDFEVDKEGNTNFPNMIWLKSNH